MIEQPPHITDKQLAAALLAQTKGLDDTLAALIVKINDRYEYWDTVKYKVLPIGISAQDLWLHVKASRQAAALSVWKRYGITLGLTSGMQRACHELDMAFGLRQENQGTSRRRTRRSTCRVR